MVGFPPGSDCFEDQNLITDMSGLVKQDSAHISCALNLQKPKLTFWLQVSVNETHQMEYSKAAGDSAAIESCLIFWDTFSWPGL